MIKGITFDEQSISAANMAHFMNTFSGKQTGITEGCTITSDASNMYMSAGYMLICGRQVQVLGTETVALQTVSTGELYCKVVYEIDLTKTNTEETFLQGAIKTLTNSSGYPVATKQDLDNGGTLYQYELAQYHVDVSGADSFVVLADDIAVDWLPQSKLRLVGTTLYIDA